MSNDKRVAVVTGGNRGIGLEIGRQLAHRGLTVVLGSRDEAAGQEAAHELGGDVVARRLDVTDTASIDALAAWLTSTHGGLDVLVNNAGISMNGFDAEVAQRTLDVNFFGALEVTDRLLRAMRPDGRVVMITSGLGNTSDLPEPLRRRLKSADLSRAELLSLMRGFLEGVAAGTHAAAGWPSSAYRVSKMGLNALTNILGREAAAAGRGILVNAAGPGWVRTAMGGKGAPRSVEEGADTPVWLALLPADGPQGGVFSDRRSSAW